MKQNPWAGLASYQDPAAGSTLLFCGRDNESYDLAALVDDNIFCTLYGKSGTGKTSLLNAGVFPRLREMGYLPVSIRLGMEAMGTTFQQCIVSRLAQVAGLQTADTVALPADEQDEQWLWAWFARTRFVDGEGKTRFAVLVFDQFEEVFRSRRDEAEALLRQIHFMMDPSHSLGESYDYNFRFLASIREDDLYLLEDSLDRNFMGDMKQCRYRLNALSDEGARDVILKPGQGLFVEGEQDEIVNTIIGIARSADGSINTNILSLVCSRIYEEYRRNGAKSISLELVRGFVSSNPFEQFYNEVTRDLGEREKRFIEDRLVDAAGRRGSVSEPDFEKNVPNGAHLLEGTGRILQRVASGTEGRSYRIELIHDSFCAPLADQKLKRAARRRRRIITALSVLALVVAAIAAYIIIMSVRNARQTREILIQQERFYAYRASQLLDEGDTYTALLLLNELTDPNGQFAKIPLQPEAERQMRRAVQMYEDTEWKLDNVYRITGTITFPPQITNGGKYVIVPTLSALVVLDSNGNYIKTIKTGTFNQAIPFFTTSHDGKKIAYQDYDGFNVNRSIKIYNLETDVISTVWLPDNTETEYITTFFHPLEQMFFSEDDRYIIAMIDTCPPGLLGSYSPYMIKAMEIEHSVVEFEVMEDGTLHHKRKFPMIGDWGLTEYAFEDSRVYGTENGNLAGRRIASQGLDGEIKIHDVKEGKLLHSIDVGSFRIFKYLNDDELLLVDYDGLFKKYSISTNKWTSLLNKKFDMTRMKDIQISEHQFMVSNKDSIFLYSSINGKLECLYIFDTNKFSYINLCDDSTLLLISAEEGLIYKRKYEPKNQPNVIEYESVASFFNGMPLQSGDGGRFISVTYGDSGFVVLRVVDVQSGNIIYSDTTSFQRNLECVSPDGKYLLVSHWKTSIDVNGDTIKNDLGYPLDYRDYHLLDIEGKKWIHTFDTTAYENYGNFFFSSDGKFVFYYNFKGDVYEKYNILSGEIESGIPLEYFYGIVVGSVNSDYIVVLDDSDDNNIWAFNTRDYSKKDISDESFKQVMFTHDGNSIIGITYDGALCVFNSRFENVEKTYCYSEKIRAVSPDNKHCVVTNRKGELELWSMYPLKNLGSIPCPNYITKETPICFSADGNSIFFYSDYITEDGPVGFVKYHILTNDELIGRIRELVGSRKLTEEEKALLME